MCWARRHGTPFLPSSRQDEGHGHGRSLRQRATNLPRLCCWTVTGRLSFSVARWVPRTADSPLASRVLAPSPPGHPFTYPCPLLFIPRRHVLAKRRAMSVPQLKQYIVTGRHVPTEKEPTPPLYKMQIFAPNHVVAKSRYWYFLSQLRKMKKATGQILDVHEVRCVAQQLAPASRVSRRSPGVPNRTEPHHRSVYRLRTCLWRWSSAPSWRGLERGYCGMSRSWHTVYTAAPRRCAGVGDQPGPHQDLRHLVRIARRQWSPRCACTLHLSASLCLDCRLASTFVADPDPLLQASLRLPLWHPQHVPRVPRHVPRRRCPADVYVVHSRHQHDDCPSTHWYRWLLPRDGVRSAAQLGPGCAQSRRALVPCSSGMTPCLPTAVPQTSTWPPAIARAPAESRSSARTSFLPARLSARASSSSWYAC